MLNTITEEVFEVVGTISALACEFVSTKDHLSTIGDLLGNIDLQSEVWEPEVLNRALGDLAEMVADIEDVTQRVRERINEVSS